MILIVFFYFNLYAWVREISCRLKLFKQIYMLGSKELGTSVLELQFVMLANHDQNVLVLFWTCSKYVYM